MTPLHIWLAQPTLHSQVRHVDVVDEMCQHVYGFVLSHPDLLIPMDYSSFFMLYAKAMLSGYRTTQSYTEYFTEFDMRYEEDLLRLFLDTQRVSDNYGMRLATTSSDFHELMRDTLEVLLAHDDDDA